MCSSKSHISQISAYVCSYMFMPVSAGTHFTFRCTRTYLYMCMQAWVQVCVPVCACKDGDHGPSSALLPQAPSTCFSSLLLDYALLVARLSSQGALGIHLSALPTALGLHEWIAIPSFHIFIISACMCGRRMCTACV